MVSDHKGINLPGVAVSVPAMSDKDVEDLRWGLRLGVDLIALSFVRSAGRRRASVHAIMDEEGIRLPVLAKIEKPQAVDNLEEIVDGLRRRSWWPAATSASSCRCEEVPLVQKRAVSAGPRARQAGHRGDPDARVDDRRRPARPGPRPPTSPTPCSTAPTR